jgi:transcriptional regulator with XRE-family HTH domain
MVRLTLLLLASEDLVDPLASVGTKARPAEVARQHHSYPSCDSTPVRYSVIYNFMQSASARLQAYMKEKGLTQKELAEITQVSQATVSRALRGEPHRRGSARDKLFIIAGISELEARPLPRDPRQRVLVAFDQIWDQTDAHADAVAQVIDALGAFRRPPPKESAD